MVYTRTVLLIVYTLSPSAGLAGVKDVPSVALHPEEKGKEVAELEELELVADAVAL